MKRRSDPARTINRFTPAVRVAHWVNAAAFAVLVFTGAVMYGAPGTRWVGHRDLVRSVHLWVGIAMFAPLVAAFAASPAVRDDVRRLARWSRDDRRWWFRSLRPRVRLGKFNPGQKANASFTLAALLTLLGTGAIMKWYEPFGDDWRTGATFVHDWTALVLGLVVVGHIVMALRDPESLRGMARGVVDTAWAERERPRWFAEVVRRPSDSGAPSTEAEEQIDPATVAERR